MTQLSLFGDLQPEQLDIVKSYFETCHFPKDHLIFGQGEEARHLYVVVQGEVVVVYKPYDAPAITVARLRPGGVFGWSAALGRLRYTSGAVCASDSTVFRISSKDLHRLCDHHPTTGKILLDHLAKAIAERVGSSHDQVLAILTQGVDGDKLPKGENTR